MQVKITPISLYQEDLDRLEELVQFEKKRACNPRSVTRSSVLRELVDIKYRSLKLGKLI